MSKKRVYATILVFILGLGCYMPFFALAASPFDVGTVKDVTVLSTNTDSSSSVTNPLGCSVTVTPFAPTLLNFDVEYQYDLSSATIQFKNSSGNNFNGTFSQSGSAYNTEGSSQINLTYNSGKTSLSGSEIATSSGSITGLTFNGLPTSASLNITDSSTLQSMYLYEEKFDIYFSIRNYSSSVYQYNVTPPRIDMALDVGHITGTLVGGEITQIDGFGELGFQRVTETSNGQLKISVTAASDYIYANRITLAPGQYLHGHFVVSAFVLRTATTTAVPSVNSITLTGCDVARAYDGVNPSVLWNLYYINQKLDHLLTAPSNSTDLTNSSSNTQSSIESQHSSEQSYFSQNEANLEATGISNFQFDSNISSGLSSITSDFGSLWGALGQWKFIYTFTLLIGLATFIIRHRSASAGKRKSDKHG